MQAALVNKSPPPTCFFLPLLAPPTGGPGCARTPPIPSICPSEGGYGWINSSIRVALLSAVACGSQWDFKPGKQGPQDPDTCQPKGPPSACLIVSGDATYQCHSPYMNVGVPEAAPTVVVKLQHVEPSALWDHVSQSAGAMKHTCIS